MDDWTVYGFKDLLVAVPSDGVGIRWETFPAVLSECPEDRDKVAVYLEGAVVIFCKRIDGRWHLDMMARRNAKFMASPEAMYLSNDGGGEWWPS